MVSKLLVGAAGQALLKFDLHSPKEELHDQRNTIIGFKSFFLNCLACHYVYAYIRRVGLRVTCR